MKVMGKLLKIGSWIIAKKLTIQFFAKIIQRKQFMMSINWNIMGLILDAFNLLLMLDKVLLTIKMFVVIALYVLLILLRLL